MSQNRQNREITSPAIVAAAMQLMTEVKEGLLPSDAEGVEEASAIVTKIAAIVREKREGMAYLEKARKRYAKGSRKWAAYTQLIHVIQDSNMDRPLFAILEKNSDEMKQTVLGEKTIKKEKRQVAYMLPGLPAASIQEIFSYSHQKKTAKSAKNLETLRSQCLIGKPTHQQDSQSDSETSSSEDLGPLESIKKMVQDHYPERNFFEIDGKKHYVRPSEGEPGKLRVFEQVEVGGKGRNTFYKMDTWKTDWATSWKKFATSQTRGAKIVPSQVMHENPHYKKNHSDEAADKKCLKEEAKLGRNKIIDAQMKKIIIDPTTDTHVLPMAVKKDMSLSAVICEQHQLRTEGIQEGLLTDDQLVRIGTAAMWALLEKMHRKGVVHLDLKGQNMMVDLSDTNHPIVNMIDYGFSKEEGDQVSFRGTPRFIANEILKAKEKKTKAAPSMDVFSTGILLLDLLFRLDLHYFAQPIHVIVDGRLIKSYMGPAWFEKNGIEGDEAIFKQYLFYVEDSFKDAGLFKHYMERYSPYIDCIKDMCKKNPDERPSLEDCLDRFENIRLNNQPKAIQSAHHIASKRRKQWNNMEIKNTLDPSAYIKIRGDIVEDFNALDTLSSDVLEEYVHTLGIQCLTNLFKSKEDEFNNRTVTAEDILQKIDDVIYEFEAMYTQSHNNKKIKTRYQKLILEAQKGRLTLDDMAKVNAKNKMTSPLAFKAIKNSNDAERINPIEIINQEDNAHLAQILQEVMDNIGQSVLVNEDQPMLTLAVMKQKFTEKAKLANPNRFNDWILFGNRYEKELIYRAVYHLDRYLKQGHHFNSLEQLLIFQQKKDVMKYCKSELSAIHIQLAPLMKGQTEALSDFNELVAVGPATQALMEKRKAFLNLQLAMKLYLKAYDMRVPIAIASLRKIKSDSANYFINRPKKFGLFSHSENNMYQKICSLRDPHSFIKQDRKRTVSL